ncbi:T9SS type A sorting domain-containing protein [Neptunitalea lumnitzerae]|uniref:T9SS C-terminal target domain-containing protein n=1 Tax=Neptunitalea lumnitzerae TaxID=2965509 RepID=A0ABQ5MM69_9FLAO|nr:T9SS type A sorting domain-containing protein [Neptunitalea sp. Y10]GLB50511.1 T9SS C-terminal target domain-containing protein [Neptunitalea sp. Y10]
MKKKLLLTFTLFASLWVGAQTKSTGVVSLGSAVTAKLDMESSTSTATLTITAPSGAWFAVRFGSFNSGQGMSGFSDAGDVVYYNGSTLVDAKMIGQTTPATDSSNDWTVTSNTVASGTRTLVATRSFNTGDSNDYVFDYNSSSIDFAYARGTSSFSISYHGSNRGYSLNATFNLLGVDAFKQDRLQLYPNPVANSLYVKTLEEVTAISIYNIDGKVVLQKMNPVLENGLNVSSLEKGVYFIEAETVNGVLYKKMIKG